MKLSSFIYQHAVSHGYFSLYPIMEKISLMFCLLHLQRSTKLLKKSLARTESTEESAAQDFSPGTPRLRVDYQEPSTPEMPDLSSVTQDICKVSPAPSQLLL